MPIGHDEKRRAVSECDAASPPVEHALGGDAAQGAGCCWRAAGGVDEKVDELVVSHVRSEKRNVSLRQNFFNAIYFREFQELLRPLFFFAIAIRSLVASFEVGVERRRLHGINHKMFLSLVPAAKRRRRRKVINLGLFTLAIFVIAVAAFESPYRCRSEDAGAHAVPLRHRA